jgi:dienelactone hydrolase
LPPTRCSRSSADIGGLREAINNVAERIADQGYTVLLPNPFYRTSRPPVFTFARKPGGPATQQRMAELLAPLTPEAMDADIAAWLDFLISHPLPYPRYQRIFEKHSGRGRFYLPADDCH